MFIYINQKYLLYQRYIMFNFEEVKLIQDVRVPKAKTKNRSKVKRLRVFKSRRAYPNIPSPERS